MSISELEKEIAEIEKIKERLKPGTLGWNNINSIIADKKKQLMRLKTQDDDEEEEMTGGCGGECGSCER